MSLFLISVIAWVVIGSASTVAIQFVDCEEVTVGDLLKCTFCGAPCGPIALIILAAVLMDRAGVLNKIVWRKKR